MPDHLKNLAVIAALAITVFIIIKRHACHSAISAQAFDRRRNLWLGLTLAVFISHNFWIYIFLASILIFIYERQESNKLALYYFILLAVPPVSASISGFGFVNYFFSINYPRLLALLILLPAFLSLWVRPDTERLGNSLPDKLILAYITLQFFLILTASTVLNTMRTGIFYQFVDILLPYYVASRSLKNIDEWRDALMSFSIAAIVLTPIAFLEFWRTWPLYGKLYEALGTPWKQADFLLRDDMFRAQGSTGHAIALGYIMAVAIGLFQSFKKQIQNRQVWHIGLACLFTGLVASLSRGPWVGTAVIMIVLSIYGGAMRSIAKAMLLFVLLLPIFIFTSIDDTIVAYLPFIGTVEESTITYRQRLLEISVQIILQNPLFGAYDYFYSPLMDELKQGQDAFIDIVNTYVAIALNSGLIGLSLFAGFLLSVVLGIHKSMTNITDKDNELHLLGRALLATIVGIMVIIFTVSSISIIPIVYWSIAGLGVSYSRILVRGFSVHSKNGST
ncbi:MAG: O-antigen ligase family protein [Steroidobacteraceae bacterium]